MRRIFILIFLLLLSMTPLDAAPPSIAGCQIFPANNPWNTDISNAPVHPKSKKYIKNILANGGSKVHPDFGGDNGSDSDPDNDWYGIPWTTATSATPLVPMNFDYDDESDPGPYPIPAGAPIEGGGHTPEHEDIGGDRHILVIETTNCILYEVYAAYPNGSGGFDAGSGAVFDLSSNELRPEGWTSADAAGLPILPGLAMCAEANTGTINHALRFTVNRTQRAFVYPATHFASSITNSNYPPMGLRFRLKANYDESQFQGQALAIVRALKQYGMILADNGSNWFISGEHNPDCWNDNQLNKLKSIPGSAFEVIVSPPPPESQNDVLLNGSFEAGTPNGKKPTFWTITAHKDRRQCDRDGQVFAYSGRCAYEFVGNGNGANDFIKQAVKIPSQPAGTSIQITWAAAGTSVPSSSGKVKIKRVYTNGTSEVISVPHTTGSYGYTAHNEFISAADVVGLKKVVVKINYKGKSGKMRFDSVAVLLDVPKRDALPLPPPAG